MPCTDFDLFGVDGISLACTTQCMCIRAKDGLTTAAKLRHKIPRLVGAFAPTSQFAQKTALFESADEPESVLTETDPISSASFQVGSTVAAPVVVDPINGWVPDDNLPCYGLPGSLPPTGYFDPLGFSRYGITVNEVKRYREAEVQHGRVAMIAFVGYVAGEAIPGPFGITGPANDQLQQMPLPAFALLTVCIAAAELKRATIGWVEPDLGKWTKTLFTLRETYYPGDVGFDPLGLKPSDAKDFANMQTRELQNGRLAMIGVAGIISQELVNHKTIMATIDFYQKVYSGIDPYQ